MKRTTRIILAALGLALAFAGLSVPQKAAAGCCGAPWVVTNDPLSSRIARVAPNPTYWNTGGRPPTPIFAVEQGYTQQFPQRPETRIGQVYVCDGCVVQIWELSSTNTHIGPVLQRSEGRGWHYFNGDVTYQAGIWVKYYY